MKKIFNILAAAVVVAGMASCVKITQEDAFSTSPAAPELYAHNDILITTNTMDEDVTFSWSAYRFLPEGLDYTLYTVYTEEPIALATTKDRYVKWTKADFKTLLYQKVSGLPENDIFSLLFYVSVPNGSAELKSANIRVSIYAAGDAVAPEITEVMEDTTLNPEDPEAMVEVMSWEPARLVYGETVTYDVFVSIAEAAAGQAVPAAEPVLVKLTEDPIEATTFSTTVDKLNEAIVAAGGVEAAANNVVFDVVAYCASLPAGIPAASASVEVTTYLATFAEKLYMPGSYQGWDPATAPTLPLSSVTKGFYQGIVDLTTADGSDVQFKFSPVPEWKDDFGGKVEVNPAGSGSFATAVGTVGVSDNIVVPSGKYYIELNKKLNTITMVQFETLSLIGSAVGDYSWGSDVDLEFDAEAGQFNAVTTFKTGEFKMRFNHDWTMSLGGSAEEGFTLSGGNIKCEKDGEYKIVVDANAAPFVIKYLNTSFPDVLYVPGSHNGWDHSKTILAGNGEGQYEGFASLGGEWGMKFTPAPDWSHGEWGHLKTAPNETAEDGTITVLLTSDDAGNVLEGTDVTYYKAVVDLTTLTATFTPITSVGIIGGFPDNNWSSDMYPMTYDADSNTWKVKGVEILKNVEWKFRMNGDWAVNLGGSLDNLVQDGGNIKLAESGIWDVELNIATIPYTCTLVKAGESEEPEMPETMFIIGSEFGGWNWESDGVVEMIPVHSAPGAFWAIRTLKNGVPFKFCATRAWNGDFHSLGENTGYTVSDGNCFVAEDGIYMIYVDVKNDKICIEPAKVYGIGNCFGGWDEKMESALFTVADGKLVGSTSGEGEIRIYAGSSIATTDWWTREFVFFDGKIAYRGTGGDQDRVTVGAGKRVILDFDAGTAAVE